MAKNQNANQLSRSVDLANRALRALVALRDEFVKFQNSDVIDFEDTGQAASYIIRACLEISWAQNELNDLLIKVENANIEARENG